jgi:glycosyltransferase involved in cell wall biosynthesis
MAKVSGCVHEPSMWCDNGAHATCKVMMSMRILHVIASLAPRYGGPSKACLELCQELARRGEQVAIYTTNIDGDGELDVPLGLPVCRGGVEIQYFPVQSPRYYKFSLPLARALRTAIPQYDLVHIHSLYLFPSTVAAHYCRHYGIPYLIRPHGTLDPYMYGRHRTRKWIYERLFEWRNLNHAAAIHFTTAEEQELTRSLGLKAPGLVVPLGVNLQDYADAPPAGNFRAVHPETHGQKLILFLGRLSFKKGLYLLAKAFGEVGRKRDDLRLVVAGPDDEGCGVQVRRWLEAEGVLEKSTFPGMLLGSEKLAAFRDADMFVLPSYTENFGIAVVEAMACRLPVVISNRVNIWREVGDANAGLVVNCDVQEVGQALFTLLEAPGLGREMGKQGRQLVEARFTWEAVGEQMIQVYEQILTKRHPFIEGSQATGSPSQA